MTDYVQPGDRALADLALASIGCRSRSRHTFPPMLSLLQQGRYEVVSVGSVRIESPCLGECGVIEVMEVNFSGQRVSRYLDYSGAKDDEGNNTYLMPKGSGRLHPEDACGELFSRLKIGAKKTSKRKAA